MAAISSSVGGRSARAVDRAEPQVLSVITIKIHGGDNVSPIFLFRSEVLADPHGIEHGGMNVAAGPGIAEAEQIEGGIGVV